MKRFKSKDKTEEATCHQAIADIAKCVIDMGDLLDYLILLNSGIRRNRQAAHSTLTVLKRRLKKLKGIFE